MDKDSLYFANRTDILFKDIIKINYKMMEHIELTNEEKEKENCIYQCVELYKKLIASLQKEKTHEEKLFEIEIDRDINKEINELIKNSKSDVDIGESLSDIMEKPTSNVKPPPDSYNYNTGKEIMVIDNTETPTVEKPKEITYENNEELKKIMSEALLLFKKQTENDLIKLKQITDVFW